MQFNVIPQDYVTLLLCSLCPVCVFVYVCLSMSVLAVVVYILSVCMFCVYVCLYSFLCMSCVCMFCVCLFVNLVSIDNK